MITLQIANSEYQTAHKFVLENTVNMKDTFTFNVSERNYELPKEYAIMCTAIREAILAYGSITKYNVSVDDTGEQFKNVVSLLSGKEVVVKKEEYPFYFQIISTLKIEPLYEQFQKIFECETVLSDCIDYLRYKQFFKLSIDNDVVFIAKNFHDLNVNDILKINKEVLIRILDNESFTIENDDDFFKLCYEVIQKNENYNFIFDYICYENLSQETLNEYVFNNMNLTKNIFNILISKIQKLKSNNNENKFIDDLYKSPQSVLNKEEQEILIKFCVLSDNAKLMDKVMKLPNFDFNLEYDIFFNIYKV